LLDQVEAGDVLTVTRPDRLARSTRDLLNTLATRHAGYALSQRVRKRIGSHLAGKGAG
jgi:hypothetical protein